MDNAWFGVFASAHARWPATYGCSLGLLLSVTACITEDPRFHEPGQADRNTATTSETTESGDHAGPTSEVSGHEHATDTEDREDDEASAESSAVSGDDATSTEDTVIDDGLSSGSGEFDATESTGGASSTDSTDVTETTGSSESLSTETQVGTAASTEDEDSSSSLDDSESADTKNSDGTTEETGDPLPDHWAIELRNPRNEVSSGPTRLSFDHAALVAAGLAADGSDLHIWVNDGAPRRLDRILDPQSSWNRDDTQIWFAPPGALGPNEVNIDDFVLRVDPDLPVIANGMRVFQLFDHFDDPAESGRRWNETRIGDGRSTIRDGVLSLDVETPEGISETLRWESVAQMTVPSFVARTRVRVSAADIAFLCGHFNVLGVYSPVSNLVRGAISVYDDNLSYARWQSSSVEMSRMYDLPHDGQWHVYELHWSGTQLHAAIDGTWAARSLPTPAGFPSPEYGPLFAAMSISTADTTDCGITSLKLEVDWIQWHPEPEDVSEARLLP